MCVCCIRMFMCSCVRIDTCFVWPRTSHMQIASVDQIYKYKYIQRNIVQFLTFLPILPSFSILLILVLSIRKNHFRFRIHLLFPFFYLVVIFYSILVSCDLPLFDFIGSLSLWFLYWIFSCCLVRSFFVVVVVVVVNVVAFVVTRQHFFLANLSHSHCVQKMLRFIQFR